MSALLRRKRREAAEKSAAAGAQQTRNDTKEKLVKSPTPVPEIRPWLRGIGESNKISREET
jgi:hypothetical protein